MNTMISNPQKSITINKSLPFIMTRLKHLGGWSGGDTGITITQAQIDYNLNRYTFMCQGFGFGNNGSVQVEEIDSEKCKVTIEIGRNYGCIDDQYEANEANQQIEAFLGILSMLIGMDESNLSNYPKEEKKKSHIGRTIAICVGVALLIAIFMM